jgi:hypothetical protein
MNTRYWLKRLFFGLACMVTFAVVLSGCGGGGGGGGGVVGGGTSGPTAPPSTAALQVNDGSARALYKNVRAAFNNAGQGVVVWETDTGYMARILWAYFDGATLHPEQELATSGGSPAVATNGTDFMLVWSSGRIYSAPCTSSGALGSTVPISGFNAVHPDIASNNSGYAVTWRAYDSGSSQNRTYTNIYSASSWTSESLIDSVSGDTIASPRIASNGTGYAIVWWKNIVNTYDIYATVSSGGTGTATWAAPSSLENLSGIAYQPSIASNGSGYAVSWVQVDGTSALSVYANIYSSGSWAPAGTLLESYTSYVYDVNKAPIASDGAGYAVAWSHAGGRINTNVYSSGTWTTASVIDNGSTNAYDVSIASNGTGYLVAWQQDDGTGNYDVYSNLYTAGSWSTPALMDDRAGDARTPVAVPFAGAAGYALSWLQDDASGNPNIFGTIYAGGAWSSPPEALVQGIWRGSTQMMRMATNKDGITLAVWPESHNGGWRIMGSLNASGAWSAPFLIDGTARGDVVIATNGTSFMVLWYDPTVGAPVAADCTSNGALGTPEKIGPATFYDAYSLALASNGSGYAAVWTQYDAGETNVFSNIYSNGSWSKDGGGTPTPWTIEDSPSYPSYNAVASNGAGYAAVWTQEDGVQYSIYGNVFSSGTWSTGGTLLETGSGYAEWPSIASNGSGYAAVWDQYDGAHYNIYANLYSAGSWSTNGTMLEDLATDGYHPTVASNGAGYAAAWFQFDGVGWSIYANVYSSGSWSSGGTRLEDQDFGIDVPSIASDGSGYAVSWAQYDGSYYSIYTNVYSAGTWSTGGTLIETEDGDASMAQIISNGNTYSVCWWKRDALDYPVFDVWARLGI